MKHTKHDNLLAPGGNHFIHNAHRPSYHEAFREFGTWSFVRGCRTSKPGVVGTDANLTSEPPQPPAAVRSGNSTTAAESVNDHELFYFEAPRFAVGSLSMDLGLERERASVLLCRRAVQSSTKAVKGFHFFDFEGIEPVFPVERTA